MLGVGGAVAITGLALVIVGKRDRSSRASEREEVDFRKPGIGVLSVGLAAVVVGATMLSLTAIAQAGSHPVAVREVA